MMDGSCAFDLKVIHIILLNDSISKHWYITVTLSGWLEMITTYEWKSLMQLPIDP